MSFIETNTQELDESKEQQLQKARSVIAGSVPLIPPAVNDHVELQRGLYRSGEWLTTVVVRELNGADEEALARVKDSLELIDSVLAHGTVQIGNIDMSTMPFSERSGIIGELLIGERSQILLAIIINTYGNDKTIKMTCADCQTEQEIDLILSEDFKPKELDNPQQILHTHTTTRGDVLEFRLAIGSDQLEALKKKGASTPEQNTIVLSRCITSRNGGLVVDPINFARSLSIKDRAVILDKLIENQPNIDLSLKTKCIGCGGDQQFTLGWLDLFQP